MADTNEPGWWHDNYVRRDRAKTARFNYEKVLRRGKRKLMLDKAVTVGLVVILSAAVGCGIMLAGYFVAAVAKGHP